MKYAAPKFRKRHESDRLSRIHREPRYLKHREQMQNTARKNYFMSQVETNDIMNEINRMEGHIERMIKPVQHHFLAGMQAQRDAKKEGLRQRPFPPPPR